MEKRCTWADRSQDYRFYNIVGVQYDESYAAYIYELWMNYDDTLDFGTEYDLKCNFIYDLSKVYMNSNVDCIGKLSIFDMEYCRNQDPEDCKKQPFNEVILIWHSAKLNDCTVIPVDGDSVEAMQRDLMRAVMS